MFQYVSMIHSLSQVTGITLPPSLTGTRQGLFTFTSTNWPVQTQVWPLVRYVHHTLRFTTFLLRTAHYWWSIAKDITYLTYKYYDKWWQLTFFCNAGTWPVYWIGAPSTAKTKSVEKEVTSRVSKHTAGQIIFKSTTNLIPAVSA